MTLAGIIVAALVLAWCWLRTIMLSRRLLRTERAVQTLTALTKRIATNLGLLPPDPPSERQQ